MGQGGGRGKQLPTGKGNVKPENTHRTVPATVIALTSSPSCLVPHRTATQGGIRTSDASNVCGLSDCAPESLGDIDWVEIFRDPTTASPITKSLIHHRPCLIEAGLEFEDGR